VTTFPVLQLAITIALDNACLLRPLTRLSSFWYKWYFKYTKNSSSKKAGSYSEDTTGRADAYRALVKQLSDEADEPWDETAEFTHGDPGDPYRGKDAQDYLNREYLRGDI
jgi:hypothetical protein